MPHTVKRGDARTLKWNLDRDLTGVTTARVIISHRVGDPPVIDRAGVIELPVDAGIVSLDLTVDDYGDGKLELGPHLEPRIYLVEVETLPGPLTHPESNYERLTVVSDLG